MTTEAVELTCGWWVNDKQLVLDPERDRCGKPIRQRTSGPCGVCDGYRHSDTHDGPRPGVPFDGGHLYDPGFDHVDLEGACAECGHDRLLHLDADQPPFDGMPAVCGECAATDWYFHAFAPPVLPLPHEATV